MEAQSTRSTTALLAARDQRHAAVRAQAAAIADAPRPQRRFTVAPGSQLRSSARRRRHNPKRMRPAVATPRRRTSKRSLVAVAVLAIQVGLLVLALNLPAFQVRAVSLTGTHLLARDDLLRSAAIPRQSIFTLDSRAVRHRLESLPWVDSASVSETLPASVHISVVERTPQLRLHRGGRSWLVADDGGLMALQPSAEARWSSVPLLLDNRFGVAPPLSAALIQILHGAAQRFPTVLGCTVVAFQWDQSGVLSIWASSGWRAVLGHADTADGVTAVPAQLAALTALRDQLHFAAPTFGYVDLENPSAPAVGGKPGLPADVSALSPG